MVAARRAAGARHCVVRRSPGDVCARDRRSRFLVAPGHRALHCRDGFHSTAGRLFLHCARPQVDHAPMADPGDHDRALSPWGADCAPIGHECRDHGHFPPGVFTVRGSAPPGCVCRAAGSLGLGRHLGRASADDQRPDGRVVYAPPGALPGRASRGAVAVAAEHAAVGQSAQWLLSGARPDRALPGWRSAGQLDRLSHRADATSTAAWGSGPLARGVRRCIAAQPQ